MSHATPEYLNTLELASLQLDIYTEPGLEQKAAGYVQTMARLWAEFLLMAQDEHIFARFGLDPGKQAFEVDLNWVGNAMMQQLNREYRDKDSSTDVLTFTLFADQAESTPWSHLPTVQLGSIFICLEWAESEVQKNPEMSLERYLMERLTHGLLHLLGNHHDTMEEFNRVVQLQQRVLNATLGVGSSTAPTN